MKPIAIVPAYNVETTIDNVVAELRTHFGDAVMVVDDGSTDATLSLARKSGAIVVQQPTNLGKGQALRTGFREALARGYDVGVTVDGDAQHPPHEAWRMHQDAPDANALVLGVRDLASANAPKSSQRSNRFSNLVISALTGAKLEDTQCGLRRYPLRKTLDLGGRARGYDYEAEIIIRALASGMKVVHVPVDVFYPPPEERVSHFDSVKDPTKIVWRVVSTVAETRRDWLLASNK